MEICKQIQENKKRNKVRQSRKRVERRVLNGTHEQMDVVEWTEPTARGEENRNEIKKN